MDSDEPVSSQCEYDPCREPARYTVRFTNSHQMPNGYLRTCRAHAPSALAGAPPHCSVTIDPD